ncbi:hypothetical protein ES705_38556 [subsurface metagenome]
MALGGVLFKGNSKLWAGPLGVSRIAFNGWDLGKTVADSNITPDQDIKDIAYQQDGTKPADHVRTGLEYLANITLGEINTGLLALLMAGISAGSDVGDDDGIIDRSIFQSMLENEAGVLKIAACDENGAAVTDEASIFKFYVAIPIITGELINWGVDTQRNLPIQFRIKYYFFTAAQLVDLTDKTEGRGGYGYWGDANDAAVDAPALIWPDKAGPEIVSAVCTTVSELTVTFDEDINFIDEGAFEATHWIAIVNGAYSAPTAGVITDAGIALVFTDEFTADGTDIVYISLVASAIEDIDDPADPPENPNQQVDNYPCTPLPGA